MAQDGVPKAAGSALYFCEHMFIVQDLLGLVRLAASAEGPG